MGARGGKSDPVLCSKRSGVLESLAAPSSQVFQCAWCIGLTSRHSTVSCGVTRPVAAEVAGAIAAAKHPDLDRHFLYFKAGTAARGEERGGRREGHVRCSEVGKGG